MCTEKGTTHFELVSTLDTVHSVWSNYYNILEFYSIPNLSSIVIKYYLRSLAWSILLNQWPFQSIAFVHLMNYGPSEIIVIKRKLKPATNQTRNSFPHWLHCLLFIWKSIVHENNNNTTIWGLESLKIKLIHLLGSKFDEQSFCFAN